MEENKKRGGAREGAGRKANDNKQFSIHCHPNVINEVRCYAKDLSREETKKELFLKKSCDNQK